jgi:uncharacterized membrane protein
MTLPKSILAGGLSLILMVVGAVSPWAKVLGVITINGTTGGRDGWVVIGAAAVALLILIVIAMTRRRWLALIPLLAGGVGAATAAYDITDINGLYQGGVASAQWGIYVALAGSIMLILASIWVIVEVRRPPKVVEEPTATPTEPS